MKAILVGNARDRGQGVQQVELVIVGVEGLQSCRQNKLKFVDVRVCVCWGRFNTCLPLSALALYAVPLFVQKQALKNSSLYFINYST